MPPHPSKVFPLAWPARLTAAKQSRCLSNKRRHGFVMFKRSPHLSTESLHQGQPMPSVLLGHCHNVQVHTLPCPSGDKFLCPAPAPRHLSHVTPLPSYCMVQSRRHEAGTEQLQDGGQPKLHSNKASNKRKSNPLLILNLIPNTRHAPGRPDTSSWQHIMPPVHDAESQSKKRHCPIITWLHP